MPHTHRKQRSSTKTTSSCDVLFSAATKKGGGADFVREYQKLPVLPPEGRLRIGEIRCFGRKEGVRGGDNPVVVNEPLVRFGEFTEASGAEYSLIEGRNEYAANEYVTPAVICCTDGVVFRTPAAYWYALSQFCFAKEIRERSSTESARTPFWVRYTTYIDLMKKLFDWNGGDYYDRQVPRQLRLYRMDDKDIDELGREYNNDNSRVELDLE